MSRLVARGQNQAYTPPPERVVEPTRAAFGPVRRLSQADMPELGEWLLSRVRKDWDYVHDWALTSWLQLVCQSNDYMALRTDNAVGVAMRFNEPLNPSNYVRDVFVYARGDNPHGEGLQIYTEFRRWAQTLRAPEMEIGNFSDVPLPKIKEALGGGRNRAQHFVEID